MPTYVYRRPDGTHFEVFQKISDDALTADPETGVPVQRVISGGAGLQFKGSGFYLTDYVKKSGTPDAGESKESKGSSESKGESKGDAKPAKESAPKASKNGSGSSPSSSASPSK